MTDTSPKPTSTSKPPPTTQAIPSHPLPPEHKPPSRGFNVWRMVIGLIVVLFGVQLLASNYGWNWAVNIDFERLWPVIIVLVGISLLSRGHAINRTVGVILTLAVIALVTALVITKPAVTSREEIRRDIAVAKEATATSSRLTLDMGAASVTVRGGSDQAATGTFTSTISDLSTTSRLEGTEQRIDLSTTKLNNAGTGWLWFGHMRNTIDLKLNDQLSNDLSIDSGAASLDLDLRTVALKRLTVDAGASSINLKLGDTVELNTTVIKSGASSIDVTIPTTVDGVRVKIDAGLSGKTVPSEFKDRGDGLYETDGYAAAKKKVDLSIDAGASSIDINWN